MKTRSGTSIIVDGGVLSNFPMWLFDRGNANKLRPVLGIKLSSMPQDLAKNEISNAFQLFGALFETMKDAHDSRYISRKHEKDIIFIPMQEGLTTEFSISEEKKMKLVEHGRECARKFLSSWAY